MGRDKRLEQIFIMAVAEVNPDKAYIKSALRLVDTDEMRFKTLQYLKKAKNVTAKELTEKMAFIAVGKA